MKVTLCARQDPRALNVLTPVLLERLQNRPHRPLCAHGTGLPQRPLHSTLRCADARAALCLVSQVLSLSPTCELTHFEKFHVD